MVMVVLVRSVALLAAVMAALALELKLSPSVV
jgi:hypothetical protein